MRDIPGVQMSVDNLREQVSTFKNNNLVPYVTFMQKFSVMEEAELKAAMKQYAEQAVKVEKQI